MNTYTLVKGRQRAEGRRQKEKKGLKGGGFFITDYPDMILDMAKAKTADSPLPKSRLAISGGMVTGCIIYSQG
ncbi:MAG: hypothetical protein F6K39_05485 [Okeania sp. SIO3B3]|nr:hypothetical protein [Okeania sp. SIO3B3]